MYHQDEAVKRSDLWFRHPCPVLFCCLGTGGRDAARHEARRLFSQVTEHLPEELLGHGSGPFPVGVGKSVAARGGRTTQAGQWPGVQLQRITQVIEADAMGQLRIAQAHHMTPGCERARLVLRPGGPRNLRDHLLRNKIENLPQDAELESCWVERFIFHPCLVAGPKRRPNTFLCSRRGTPVIKNNVWLLEFSHEQTAEYYPGFDFNPRQRLAFAAELFDADEEPVSPQPMLQALPIVGSMTRFSVGATAIRNPLMLKNRI
jgi:hypothetical protein